MAEANLPDDLFQEIRRDETLSSRVAGQLEKLIFEDRLRPGDRLPPERVLAERFGVSRTVVREAVRALVARRLLEVHSGSGTIVSSLEPGVAAEFMSSLLGLSLRSGKLNYSKVIEVRRILEVEIAGFAAQRRTEKDIQNMEEILRKAESNLGDPAIFVETDISFHETLAQATQNLLFLVLLSSITDVLIEGRQLAVEVPGFAERALSHHQRILSCVRDGDSEKGREAMYHHMNEARETMQKALRNRSLG